VIKRALNSVFEIAKGSLCAPQGIEPRSCQNRELNLRAVETQAMVCSRADCLLNDLRLSFLELIQRFHLSQFP